MRKIACSSVCVFILASCAPATTPSDEARRVTDTSVDAPPGKQRPHGPDFQVETFEGRTFSLAEHRGTPVVLNFWESW